MDRHVPEQTRRRWPDSSRGAGAGSRLTMINCSSRPMSPAAIRSCTSRNDGSKRRLNPTITVGFSAAISTQHRSTRAKSRSIGFSQSTALPARTARVSRSTWVGVAEAMTTASTLGSSIAVSTLAAVAAPYSLGYLMRSRLDRVIYPGQLGPGMDIDRVGVYASDPAAAKQGEADQPRALPSSSCASSVSSSPPAICRVSSSSVTSERFLSSTAWPSFKMMKWLPTRYAWCGL